MILYADSSSLAKLYIEEEGSAETKEATRRAQRVVSSLVAYAELRAALARARSNTRINEDEFRLARARLDADWRAMLVIDVSNMIVERAGDLADRYLIRGFDAIHLASAQQVRELNAGEVQFSTADRRLGDAAVAEGFSV